jgi:hypothetical protein
MISNVGERVVQRRRIVGAQQLERGLLGNNKLRIFAFFRLQNALGVVAQLLRGAKFTVGSFLSITGLRA